MRYPQDRDLSAGQRYPQVDNAIQWINLNSADNAIGFLNYYSLDGDLSGGQRYPKKKTGTWSV